MKRIICFVTVLLALGLTQYASALGTPDFSGTWVLDSASGDMGPRPGAGNFAAKGKITLLIKQTQTTLSVDRKAGNHSESAVLKLNGTESINKLPSGREKKSTASWAGSTLVVKSTTDMGNVTVPSTEVFSLSPDGKVMTIDMTVKRPNGETKRKLIYNIQ